MYFQHDKEKDNPMERVRKEGGILPYEHSPGEYRSEYFAGERERWIVFISMGGSAVETKHLGPGESWREGSDEFIRSFESKYEAERFAQEYVDSL